MRSRPCTSRLFIAAAMGVVTTLCIAWLGPGLLHGVIPFRWRGSTDLSSESGLPKRVRWGHSWISDIVLTDKDRRAVELFVGVANEKQKSCALPTWAPPPKSLGYLDRLDTRATGFPFRAMVCRAGLKLPPSGGYYGVAWVKGGVYPTGAFQRFAPVPLTPLWGGLAGDAVIWGAAWWVGIAGVGAGRAWWRRRKAGTCGACGYDLRGLPAGAPCPECGGAGTRR